MKHPIETAQNLDAFLNTRRVQAATITNKYPKLIAFRAQYVAAAANSCYRSSLLSNGGRVLQLQLQLKRLGCQPMQLL